MPARPIPSQGPRPQRPALRRPRSRGPNLDMSDLRIGQSLNGQVIGVVMTQERSIQKTPAESAHLSKTGMGSEKSKSDCMDA